MSNGDNENGITASMADMIAQAVAAGVTTALAAQTRSNAAKPFEPSPGPVLGVERAADISATATPTPESLQLKAESFEAHVEARLHAAEALIAHWYRTWARGADTAAIIKAHSDDLAGSEVLKK